VTLAEALDAAAAAVPDVSRREVPAGTEWATGQTVFAALAGDTASFRLDPVIGLAALGTPDTARSPRGEDWVDFTPPVLDRIAVDRAAAWFASAWRRVSP
jgi:hypothetical protein